MVGIRDRAGRCDHCKHRKIKCDLSRPSCIRCRQLGLRCGYSLLRKGDVFLNRTMASPFNSIVDASSVADSSKIWDVAARCRQTHGRSSSQICEEQRAEALPQSPSPILAYMTQLLSSFIDLYLPKDSHQGAISGRTPSSWVHLLAYSTLQSSAYITSLAALCTAQLGTWHKDEAMLNESIRLYASSLRELRTKILNGNIQDDSEATLASIVLLSTYETFSSSTQSGDGWISHVQGGSRMLQHLGPSVRKTTIGEQLSARIRTICILEALRTRKTSTIAAMDWPYDSSNPSRTRLFDTLQGLMIRIPYIMEALDIIQGLSTTNADNTANRRALFHLLQSCLQVSTQLLAWHKELQLQVTGELYTVVPAVAHNPVDDEIRGQVFPLAIHFKTLSVAQLVLLYWSTMILLYRTIVDVQMVLGEHYGVTKDTIPRPDARSLHTATNRGIRCPNRSSPHSPLYENIVSYAANICQSIEYCYNSENGTLGLQSTVFTIWAAQDFYASQPALYRQFQWCSEIGNMTAPNSRFDLKVMKLKNSS